MNDAKIRFVPREVDKRWRVYDTLRASYPYQTGLLGVVRQDQDTQEDAQTEADRLNELIKPAEKKKAKPTEKKIKKVKRDV